MMNARSTNRLFALIALIAFLTSRSNAAEGWPQFRGANTDGICETKIPTEWSSDKNIDWKVKIPGSGWSQPVAWGNKVFVTTAESEKGGKPARGVSGPGFDPKAVKLWVPNFEQYEKLRDGWIEEWNKTYGYRQ